MWSFTVHVSFIKQQGELVGQKQSWEVGFRELKAVAEFSPQMQRMSSSTTQTRLPFPAAKYTQYRQKEKDSI